MTSLCGASRLRSRQAEAPTSQALALAEELGMRPLQAHCHRGLGTLYATTGQREQARTELSTAIEMYRAMEMTFWLPQTEAALAQVERVRQRGGMSLGCQAVSARLPARGLSPRRRARCYVSAPEAGGNMALLFAHRVGINCRRGELRMAQPALHEIERNPFLDTGHAKPMPQALWDSPGGPQCPPAP